MLLPESCAIIGAQAFFDKSDKKENFQYSSYRTIAPLNALAHTTGAARIVLDLESTLLAARRYDGMIS